MMNRPIQTTTMENHDREIEWLATMRRYAYALASDTMTDGDMEAMRSLPERYYLQMIMLNRKAAITWLRKNGVPFIIKTEARDEH